MNIISRSQRLFCLVAVVFTIVTLLAQPFVASAQEAQPALPNAPRSPDSAYSVRYPLNWAGAAACSPIIVVTTTADSGAGSLRQAIGDLCPAGMITFAPGLTASGPATITLSSGELELLQDLTIAGPGATRLTVSGNHASRIFNVDGGADAIISGLTLRDGISDDQGGAIWNMATLTVISSTLTHNAAPDAGGIASGGILTVSDSSLVSNTAVFGGGAIRSWGKLTVIASRFADNSAGTVTDSGYGGGIADEGNFALLVIGSTFANNYASGKGGAISSNQGKITLADTNIYGNTSAHGGGFYGGLDTALTIYGGVWAYNMSDGGGAINGNGSVTITNSSFLTNTAVGWRGGAISGEYRLAITGSTFAGNTAPEFGGGAIGINGSGRIETSSFHDNLAGFGGAILNGTDVAGGELVVTASALYSNTATSNEAGDGGGAIYNQGSLVVGNSSFAGNAATEGGGIYSSGALTVGNSTLAYNVAGDGGGIFIALPDEGTSGTLALLNAILAANSGGDCRNNGQLTRNVNNLIRDGSCDPALSGDPELGTLGTYSGPTLVFPLQPDSPAVNAGDNTTCLATDQRGITRPQGPTCDIGAFELVPELKLYMPALLRE